VSRAVYCSLASSDGSLFTVVTIYWKRKLDVIRLPSEYAEGRGRIVWGVVLPLVFWLANALRIKSVLGTRASCSIVLLIWQHCIKTFSAMS
jgi:hypothetical protein